MRRHVLACGLAIFWLVAVATAQQMATGIVFHDRAVRRPDDYQMNIYLPDSVPASELADTRC